MDVLNQLENQLASFEDACKIEGLDPQKVIPSFELFPKKDQKSMQAHAKWIIIVKAANKIGNGGKEYCPDFSNRNEYKYEIWWEHLGGSRGFRSNDCVIWHTFSLVGSRLCFISWEVAKYVGHNFAYIWNEYSR